MSSSARIDELRQKFDENPRRYFAPLANEYRKVGDLEQAIFICQEYLPQQPGHMSGHIVYGQALFEAKRNDEARAVFETALALDPENLIALRHLGDIAREGGDVENARRWYTRGLDADPRNVEMSALLVSLPSPEIATHSPQAFRPILLLLLLLLLRSLRSFRRTSVASPAADLAVNQSTFVAAHKTPVAGALAVSWLEDAPARQPEPGAVSEVGPASEPAPSGADHELIDLGDMVFSNSAPTPVISQPAIGDEPNCWVPRTASAQRVTAFGGEWTSSSQRI